MLKLLLLPLLLISCSKEHKPNNTTISLVDLIVKKDFYLQKLKEQPDVIYLTPCDKITFKALVSAFSFEQDLSKFEYPVPGKWNRNEEVCYPLESDSEISRDGFLSLFHYWLTYKDKSAIDRTLAYAEDNNYNMGEGTSSDLTNILPLVPIFKQLKTKVDSLLTLEDTNIINIDSYFSNYKGHLLASYLLLEVRLTGYLNVVEIEVLKKLHKESVGAPIIEALYHRFTDGNQSEAVSILANESLFPSSKLPTEELGKYWGSSPALTHYLIALAITEGKY